MKIRGGQWIAPSHNSSLYFHDVQESFHHCCSQKMCLIDVDTRHHKQVLLSAVTIITSICSIYCPIIFISAKVHWTLHHSFTLCTGELWLSFGDDTLPIFTCVECSHSLFWQIIFGIHAFSSLFLQYHYTVPANALKW